MIGISLLVHDSQKKQQWIEEIEVLQKTSGYAIGQEVCGVEDGLYELILVDASHPRWQDWVSTLDREGKSVILVLDEHAAIPTRDDFQWVDDVIQLPFKVLNLASQWRAHHLRKQNLNLMNEMTQSQEVIEQASRFLEQIQKSQSPQRFTQLKGIKVQSKHLSGLKPGGDYFDIFESDKKDYVNILVADSSSYGLSSALLGTILSSSARIANDAHISPHQWVKAIYGELQKTVTRQDHLSLFFGRLNRIDFSLSYALMGSVEVLKLSPSGENQVFEKTGEALRLQNTDGTQEGTQSLEPSEKRVYLQPKDRLLLVTDGFVHGVGGLESLTQVLNDKKEQDAFYTINELGYLIKSKLRAGESFPGEDCSAMIVDVESRVLRLAPTG